MAEASARRRACFASRASDHRYPVSARKETAANFTLKINVTTLCVESREPPSPSWSLANDSGRAASLGIALSQDAATSSSVSERDSTHDEDFR